MNPNKHSFEADSATFFTACTSHMDWDWIGTFVLSYASINLPTKLTNLVLLIFLSLLVSKELP